MGGLARRENTWTIRLALFPFAALSVLYGGYGFISLDPDAVGDMTGQGSSSERLFLLVAEGKTLG